MQNLTNSQTINPAERVYSRFMDEHSLYRNILKDYPEFAHTPVELKGVYSKLAMVQSLYGFDYLKEQVLETINRLTDRFNTEMDYQDLSLNRQCIYAQLAILDMLHWLDAYGPRVFKKK